MLTHLGSFEGRSAFRTWVWRIGFARHLLRVRQGQREAVSFSAIAERLREGESAPPLDVASAEEQLARYDGIGCRARMFLALGRSRSPSSSSQS